MAGGVDIVNEAIVTPGLLILLSAIILALLGTGHLILTYRGPKLRPRDDAVQKAMEEVSPVIAAQTTMWRCWKGFNASHSIGAILFGLVFGYLALFQEAVFFESPFLQGVGLVTLCAYVVLARLYWFVTPLAGLSLALFFYAAGLWLSWV